MALLESHGCLSTEKSALHDERWVYRLWALNLYALSDRGARLLVERDRIEFANIEWSRMPARRGIPFRRRPIIMVAAGRTVEGRDA